MKRQWSFEFSCGIGNIECINVVRDEGFQMNFPTGRKKYRFVYVKCGKMRYSFEDGEEYEVAAGRIMYVPEGTVYSATYLENGTFAVIVLFDLLYGELPDALVKPRVIDIPNAGEIVSGISDCPENVGLGRERAVYYTYRTYELIWNAISGTSGLPEGGEKLAPAIKEINNKFAEQRDVAYYARLCYMSETGLRRLFRKIIGASPIEYRNKIRLEEAKKLIRSGEYTVEEAARSVGFTNISFFCREYRKYFGCTPLGKR